MSDSIVSAIVILALLMHIVVGVAVGRRMTTLPLLPILNLVVGLAILAYWVQRWIGAATKGYMLYKMDQLFPLYGLLVSILAIMTLNGKVQSAAPNWIVFGIHALALGTFALFMMTFKMNRLM